VLDRPALVQWAQETGFGRELVNRAVNLCLDELRVAVLSGALEAEGLAGRLETLPELVRHKATGIAAPHLRHVINATGVVVHTNLGRSPWPAAAAARVSELGQRYVNLEFDLESGGRGQRAVALERLVGELLPGTATAVVNNNAAAVLLTLNTLAEGKEVIVSRGQLVEIGGSFRIPDVMHKSQSILREVGTTNRTRISDFEAAIGPATGMLLSVHPSNYRVVGFTEEAGLAEIVELGHEHDIPVVEDLGSGCLIDLREVGIHDEPSVQDRLATGVDLVSFSGDKLLGGPQAGFIVGKPEYVARVRANPLYRALRLDKVTTLGLEATLAAYVTGRLDDVPAVRMLRTPTEDLEARAKDLAERLASLLGSGASPECAEAAVSIEVVPVSSQVGGGAAPGRDLASFGLAIEAPTSPDDLMTRLRNSDPPVIGRIIDDRVVLDVRTVLPDEDEALAASVTAALDG